MLCPIKFCIRFKRTIMIANDGLSRGSEWKSLLLISTYINHYWHIDDNNGSNGKIDDSQPCLCFSLIFETMWSTDSCVWPVLVIDWFIVRLPTDWGVVIWYLTCWKLLELRRNCDEALWRKQAINHHMACAHVPLCSCWRSYYLATGDLCRGQEVSLMLYLIFHISWHPHGLHAPRSIPLLKSSNNDFIIQLKI